MPFYRSENRGSIGLRNLTLCKKYAGRIGPRMRKTKRLNGSKDDIAKAKGMSEILNQYLNKKEKNFLTNFKQFGGIKLLASRKQTHFGGSCPEGVFNS